jgi:hypothetical protein
MTIAGGIDAFEDAGSSRALILGWTCESTLGATAKDESTSQSTRTLSARVVACLAYQDLYGKR